jgi:hypothetical protein
MRRAHADAVSDEVTDGQGGVVEGVVETLSFGLDFEGAALGHPVDDTLGETLLGPEVGLEDPAQQRSDLACSLAESPVVLGQDVEALVHEEDHVAFEELRNSEQSAGRLVGLERNGEALGEPQDWHDVADIAYYVQRTTGAFVCE